MRKFSILFSLFCFFFFISVPVYSMETREAPNGSWKQYFFSYVRPNSHLNSSLKKEFLSSDREQEDGRKADLADLSGQYIGLTGVKRLCSPGFVDWSHIAVLNLSANSISDQAGAIVAGHLTQCPGITNLDLSHNYLSRKFTQALAKNSHLSFLDVSHNRINSQEAATLLNILSLTDLNLNYNSIDDLGPVFIALGNHQRLKELRLSCSNYLGGDKVIDTLLKGMGIFGVTVGIFSYLWPAEPIPGHCMHTEKCQRAASMLNVFKSMQVVFPSLGIWTYYMSTTMKYNVIWNREESNRCLEKAPLKELDLSGNFSSDLVVKNLPEIFQNITTLNLSQNEITDGALIPLLGIKSLTSLDTSHNKITIGNPVVNPLANNKTLLALDLQHNPTNETSIKNLEKIFERNITLQHLFLSNVSEDDTYNINASLETNRQKAVQKRTPKTRHRKQ